MAIITIGDRSFQTPILIPSVSSFETQLNPRDALRLQYTMREPISLVSSYDVSREREELVSLCKVFRRQGVLLLDSGGYETQRIDRYALEGGGVQRWTFGQYAKLAAEDIYDFIFSYDYFLNEHETAADFSRADYN
jgi:hypothetical protein